MRARPGEGLGNSAAGVVRALLLGLVASCGGTPPASMHADLVRAPVVSDSATPDVDWGIYRIYWSSRDYGADMAALRERHPRPPSYVMFYRDLGHLDFPGRAVQAIRGLGAAPLMSLELWTWHDAETRRLQQLIDGRFDEALGAWARAAAAEGGRILLRFGFEMNGDWFSWNGDPDRFVQAWRHVHRLFDDAGAHNVEWLWTPNVTDVPDDPANARERYYPGDEVVDWVGLDGYNFGEQHDRYHHWQSFAEVFEEPLEQLTAAHPSQPVFLSETGCAPGDPGAKARWIREAWATLAAHPEVRAVVWFDLDKRREGEPDWRLDSEPSALAAFNETFAAEPSPLPGH